MTMSLQPIIIDVVLDKPRRLRLGFPALKRFTAKTGIDIFRNPDDFSNMRVFAELVHACAVEEDPTVTLDTIQQYISVDTVYALAEALKRLAEESQSLRAQLQGRN